ncbi:MAG TPA: NAD(P)/FAD-dependent oxidoreductase [Thermoleophilaceae bacterium]|nr:NAD(P)/FAD-dependent oxidoreductase [Thermoleophilaceae bacterium]
MARTPLAGRIEELASDVRAGYTRRDALKRAGFAAGGMVAASATRWAPLANAAPAPRIAVVGGGLAGLTATYRLKQAGYVAQLYEARTDRLGGRCWSDTFPGSNLIYEHGGELIDQGHVDIRQLVQELGLNLVNLVASETNGTETFHLFDGQFYSFTDATNDLKQIWQQIHNDISAASYPTLWDSNTRRGRELDAMSITDWINAYVPGGMGSKLGQLLDVAYNIEYGAECTQQSSLNMLYLLGYAGPGQMRIFGKSDEKYHVVGGNDQIPERLAANLSGQINVGYELTGVARNSDGTWTLSFNNGRTVKADRVVIAIPFSILRSVNLKKAQFEPRKLQAINELGMGTNAKMHVGFKKRFWRDLGCTGETYSDTGYQNTWEVSRGQSGATGLLVDYTGGNIGASFGSGTPTSRAQQFLAQIEPLLPGATANWNGNATLDFWSGYQWTKGSYSYWKVGQYTSFAGIERTEQNGCHFAGEHTSIDFQGYLQGGVETGERAAAEIIAAYKH